MSSRAALAAVAAACASAASAMPPVCVDRQPIDETVEPVPMVEPFSYEARDGLLLRDGQPFFWISDGSLGGVHSTPLGLWLAKLHGTTLASVPHNSAVVRASEGEGGIRFAPTLQESYFSWVREAIRLGFLAQAPEGAFHPAKMATLPPLLAKYPELIESIDDHGHYMGADPGTPLGLDVLDARRYPLFAYGGRTGFFLPELNREPGPDPHNERARRGFRDWARAKYGSLDEANAVWRTAFAAWDDVTLPHTTGECAAGPEDYAKPGWQANLPTVRGIRNKRAGMRARERRETPELYWDWLQYVLADTTATTRREFEHARAFAPGALFGSDVRGHQSNRDNYCAYDPVAMDAMADVFYVHSSGFRAYDYAGRPFEPKTLHDAICWPLFTARFFRCNTTKPIIDSEDIVHDTIAAAPSEEAMDANDLAKFRERTFTARRRPDGGGRLSCDFTVPARLEADRADGSARFYLAGRAPAAFGAALNGKDLGYFGSVGGLFQIDVTAALEFGATNTLELRYDGENKIPPRDDPRCHILTQETLGAPGPYGEKQYKSQFWSYLMGGFSADIVWHWTTGDKLRLWQAALTRRLEAAAPVVQPAVRFRKERVAFLYGYLAGVGLPASQENRHHELMDWAGALEFTGHRYDVLGEERFRRDAADYPVVVVPDVWCVADETAAAAMDYVRGGGTLVLTPGSLGKTYGRYRDSGLTAFAASGDTGAGRVVILETGLGMEALAERLAPLLPPPELDVKIAPSAEFPCVERLLVGDARRKVLYLQNWGGLDHTCRVTLPEECRGWRVVPLEGAFSRTADGRLATRVEGSQGVAVCMLLAPGETPPDLALPSETAAAIERVRDLMTFGRPAPGAKRVLFALDDDASAHSSLTGVLLFPHLVEAVRELGAEADAVPPRDWTPELLSRYAAVVVTEGDSLGYWEPLFGKPEFRAMLKRYVEEGGALFGDIYAGRSVCANARFSQLGKEAWGVEIPFGGKVARDETSHGFGDPRQIRTDNLAAHPIAEGVGSVQLFALVPLALDAGSPLAPVVSLPATSTKPGAPVLAAGEVGRGRVAVMADPMAFQPYRIGEAGNARLLRNLFAWLLGDAAGARANGRASGHAETMADR